MTRQPRQLEVPGTHDPDEPEIPPDFHDRLHDHLGQEENLKAERERMKDQRDSLIASMVEAGIERIPYTDATSGKRKYFVADRTARAKKISAAGSDGKAKRARERDVEIGEEIDAKKDIIEQRRVRRTREHDELADPFAATRKSMETEH